MVIEKRFFSFFHNKRAQLSLFIILGLIIVGAVVLFVVFREDFSISRPSESNPVYSNFYSCMENQIKIGIGILESRGGYINLPDFVPGSPYMPFSSVLNFMGTPIPYWYFISGNNLEKTQVPTKRYMEKELASFIENSVEKCKPKDNELMDFTLVSGGPKAEVNIKEGSVSVSLDMPLVLKKGNQSFEFREHSFKINSNLGSLYNSALKVYDFEQENLFLEKYSEDILRLYAPTDGVEMKCSPLVWKADDVFNNLQDAFASNIPLIKPGKKSGSVEEKYFYLDESFGNEVRFVVLKSWPYSFEVAPSKGGLLIAEPIGNEPGLGVLGFCYVPYHFVYNIAYPVLVQVYKGEEVFQFPVAVVLRGNLPRNSTIFSSMETPEIEDVCNYKNTPFVVNVMDYNFEPIEDAEVEFECLGVGCYIGKTNKEGVLDARFPQCVNGFIRVSKPGYASSELEVSTNQEGNATLFMKKEYPLEVELRLNNTLTNRRAIIYFASNDSSKTIFYPDNKFINLSKGQYEIQVMVFDNSSIDLPKVSYEKCVDVPRSGLFGFFGMTEKKCFNVEVPKQIISDVLVGGGKQKTYIIENDLKNNVIVLNVRKFGIPKSLEDIQKNYELVDVSKIGVSFK